MDAEGRVIAHPEPERLVRAEGDAANVARLHELDDPVLTELFARWRQGATDARVTVGGREWIGVARRMPAGVGEESTLLFTAPRDEILAGARDLARQQLLIGLLLLALAVSLIWLLARRISRPLEGLAAQARAIRGFEFGERPRASTWITEVDDLAEAMAGMRATIRQFLETSSAVAAEEHVDRLLERVIEDTVRTAGAQEGALYLIEEGTGALARASYRDPRSPVEHLH